MRAVLVFVGFTVLAFLAAMLGCLHYGYEKMAVTCLVLAGFACFNLTINRKDFEP